MNKKFFFFDIDGTLAVGTPGRQYIPESTKKAIRMLKEQGRQEEVMQWQLII